MQEAKPFQIDKRIIFEAFKKVKSNGGSPGIDGIEMSAYEQTWFQLLSSMESHELRQLYAQSGKTCGNSEIKWW